MEIVQMVNPLQLWEALDGTVDSDNGNITDYTIEIITGEKLDEAFGDSDFWDGGIKNPICVTLGVVDGYYGDRRTQWILGNGHHRLAYAIAGMLDEIPVVFTEANDYMLERFTCPEEDGCDPDWTLLLAG